MSFNSKVADAPEEGRCIMKSPASHSARAAGVTGLKAGVAARMSLLAWLLEAFDDRTQAVTQQADAPHDGARHLAYSVQPLDPL